jgi:hypothetical protein
MVGVDVRVDDIANRHAKVRGGPDVAVGRIDRVDDRTKAFAAASDEVRGGDHRLGMQELAEDHAPLAIGSPAVRQSGSPSFARRAR